MKTKLLTILSLALIACTPLMANTAIRSWTKSDESKFKAMIMNWDAQTDDVTLADDAGKKRTIKRTDLSLSDQAYVRQWFKHRNLLDEKLKSTGGSLDFLQTTGTYQTDYYVYKPSTFKANGSAPIMILFSSAGTGYRMMLRHFEAAEKTGFVLITADYFSNHTLDFYNKRNLQKVSKNHFKELLPQLETISHDPNKLYMGGDSGGALRAYIYSATFDRPWAGIYANGGWLGRDYTMKCRTHMRVAMVNGHKDIAAIQSSKKDSDYLADKRQCEIALFSFEGGHQLATTDAQVEAFTWLLNQDPTE